MGKDAAKILTRELFKEPGAKNSGENLFITVAKKSRLAEEKD